MLEPEYSRQAEKFLKNIDIVLRKRITDKIEELAKEPIGHDEKRVHGFREKLFRARVGDYRVLYEVDYESETLGIIKIDKRERVY
jgi:mRNA interferase RelE/StbE